MRRNAVVVQPYVPNYRVKFFTLLRARLDAVDIDLTLVGGNPTQKQARRNDAESSAVDVTAPARTLKLFGNSVRYQSSRKHWWNADAVILEASGSLLDTSLALLTRGPRVGIWGHIDDFTRPGSRVDTKIESWQIQRAKAVLAYTSEGAASAKRIRGHGDGVFTLNNTTDTINLIAYRELLNRQQASNLLGVQDLPAERTLAYIGGLDAAKRIDFLVLALDELWALDSSVRLLVGGEGEDAGLLSSAVARGQVVMLGKVGDREKAALAHCAAALLMPGRVGLVAIDSFALGLPLITTDWPFHAPEFAYLDLDNDSVLLPDEPSAYARGVTQLLLDESRLAKLRTGALEKAGWPSLDNMTETFVAGIRHITQT